MNSAKILVVDDDVESRELIAEVLGANGYLVESVGDGSLAREILRHDDGYSIVIADLRMPNETGLELLQNLRKQNYKQGIILMSSFIGVVERAQAEKLGAHALLEKPFRLSELLQVVGELAARHPLRVTTQG